MLQVPFFICRYLLLNIQVPISTRQQAIHGTVLFTPDLLTPHTVFTSLPATVPVFWNVSTHFFYPCAHSVVASSTRCHVNRRKLNTYRETRPPSWEKGTWQVPSQLSHSELLASMRHDYTMFRTNIIRRPIHTNPTVDKLPYFETIKVKDISPSLSILCSEFCDYSYHCTVDRGSINIMMPSYQ